MKPFSCDAFIALEGDSGRRSDLRDKPSTERGWLVAIGDLDKCPCIGYPTHGRPSVCLVSVGYRELRLGAGGYFIEVHNQRPFLGAFELIAARLKPSRPSVRTEVRPADADL